MLKNVDTFPLLFGVFLVLMILSLVGFGYYQAMLVSPR